MDEDAKAASSPLAIERRDRKRGRAYPDMQSERHYSKVHEGIQMLRLKRIQLGETA
jgi:hypothetical protein